MLRRGGGADSAVRFIYEYDIISDINTFELLAPYLVYDTYFHNVTDFEKILYEILSSICWTLQLSAERACDWAQVLFRPARRHDDWQRATSSTSADKDRKSV